MPDAPPLTFRDLAREPAPADGELWIQAAAEHGDCRALALLAIDHGIGAFRRGGAEIRKLVVHHDPTLDDVLAAHLVRKLIAGEKLPATFRHFARYAALVREGLRPSDSIPVEDSLEGAYLFIRTEAGHKDTNHSLADPDASRRFLAAWSQLAERIDDAAANPAFDPFAKSPLTGDPEFGRVRTFLEKDRCNFRDDVRRGRVFRASLPEVARCAALFLREPKSLLFRYWFRDDVEAPGGEGYRLLMVDWGRNNWVMSTDPRKRISLQVLCERLQAVEPPGADGVAGQWFNGRPFRHTLIAAPHGGTRLAEKQVLKTVAGWARLRSAKTQPTAVANSNMYGDSWKKYVAMFFVPVIGGVTNYLLLHRNSSDNGQAKKDPTPLPIIAPADPTVRGGEPNVPKPAVLPPGGVATHTFAIPDDMLKERSLSFRVILRGGGDEALPDLRASVDGGPPSRLQWDKARVFGSERWSTDLKLDPLPAEPIAVTLRNAGPAPIRYTLQPYWETDRRTLYILSIGVTEYAHRVPLPCAEKDAPALADALTRHKGDVFHRVQSRVRLNREATKTTLLKDLEWLVAEARPGDFVIVTIAGHGELHSRGEREFYFLLSDSNPSDPLGTNDLSWREISRDLGDLKCSAAIVMDCCHSGGIVRGSPDDASAALREEVNRALTKVSGLKRGLLYLAACQADELAQENKNWGHGALTLGLLEYLDGKSMANVAPPRRLDGANRVLYLRDWCSYAIDRVQDLTKRGQSATMRETENFKSQWIPLGVLKEK